jgi:hypothetical protein
MGHAQITAKRLTRSQAGAHEHRRRVLAGPGPSGRIGRWYPASNKEGPVQSGKGRPEVAAGLQGPAAPDGFNPTSWPPFEVL